MTQVLHDEAQRFRTEIRKEVEKLIISAAEQLGEDQSPARAAWWAVKRNSHRARTQEAVLATLQTLGLTSYRCLHNKKKISKPYYQMSRVQLEKLNDLFRGPS